jgi:hypothetical protein
MTDVTEQAELDNMPQPAIPPSEVTRYQPGAESWEDMRASADTAFGYDLVKDELADALAGIPFLITRVLFRPGITRDIFTDTGKEQKQFAFVTAEVMLTPDFPPLAKINAARKSSKMDPIASFSELPFEPGDHIVLNDGSTGVYRDITRYLHTKGIIVPAAEITDQGALGESSYDLPPGDWTEVTAGDLHFNEDGFGIYTADVRLYCPRGLRLSKYENDYTAPGEQATTRYIG